MRTRYETAQSIATPKMLLVIFFFLGSGVGKINGVLYDCYTSSELTEDLRQQYEAAGNLKKCTNDIKMPCDPDEWRRVDGSCNNLHHPAVGMRYTPSYRVLKPVYGEGYTNRKSVKGGELPLPRRLRTNILAEGKVSDKVFNQLMSYFILYIFTDVGSIQDTLNYVLINKHCCEPRGKSDYGCTPGVIPDDDPVHRFTNVRCMNQTRPITFQTHGCVKNGSTTPTRSEPSTSMFDLSSVYNYLGNLFQFRSMKGGELNEEIKNGKVWVPSVQQPNICVANQLPEENLCINNFANGVLGGKYGALLFYRLHNVIARGLAAVNTCWDDDRLYFTARDINIAIEMQIFLYEMLVQLMGKNNLIRDGMISSEDGFRDLYDENNLPLVSEEFIYILRWFHTIQETTVRLYDNRGTYVKDFPMVNITFRTGYFLLDKNMEHITQSSFRQPGGAFDHTVDPDISELGLGSLQYSSDITMNDLNKGRTLGLPAYKEYLEFCHDKNFTSFKDLLEVMEPERAEILKNSYQAFEDIDLIAGLWSERKVKGGHLPSTIYCIILDQMKRSLTSDRHWYERQNRPHAFTLEQLLEIRKVTMAGMMCQVGDSVTEIQRKAFLRISKNLIMIATSPTHLLSRNPLVSCEDIPWIDYSKWKDNACDIETEMNL